MCDRRGKKPLFGPIYLQYVAQQHLDPSLGLVIKICIHVHKYTMCVNAWRGIVQVYILLAIRPKASQKYL